MDIRELAMRKRELEVRLSVAIANELSRFVQDTGVRVLDIDIPMHQVYEFGSMREHSLVDVEVLLELE